MSRLRTPLVTFWLGTTEYAFDVFDAVEMTADPGLTRVPGASPRVAGVTTWRGKTIPVLDLAVLLKLDDPTPDVKKRLLVLGRPGPFAVLIDRPGRILPADETAPVIRSGREADDAADRPGLIRADRGLVRILDPVRLVGDGRDWMTGDAPAPRRESLR